MRLFRLILLVVYVSYSATSLAQEKYAVLITGDYAAQGIPSEDQWNNGQGRSIYGYEEFWYDTYLMWEMLVYEKGYKDENVFVLFANGLDYSKPNMCFRYNAQFSHNDNFPITDYSATIMNVQNVFNGLANGTGGFPQVTEDDFLFVWTFDHGGYEPSSSRSYLYLLGNTIMYDDEFAALTNQIHANKKVFWMQQCHSGGFSDNLGNSSTVFHAACQATENAFKVDNMDINHIPVDEGETVNGNYYPHGEYNFHNYCAVVGESPSYMNNYNGEPFTQADENIDNFISVFESYKWEDAHESIDFNGFLVGEEPVYADLGSIGSNTTLEYPTILYKNIYSNTTSMGLIGITKTIHVLAGNELTIHSNADLYLLNDVTLYVDEGATLVIEDNVQIFGNLNNNIQVNGNVQIGQNVIFGNESGSFGGLFLYNRSHETSLTGVTFNRCGFLNYGQSLTINNCTFNKCENEVYSVNGNITINNSIFNETGLFLQNNSNIVAYSASVKGCIISKFGLGINYYGEYYIEDNQINSIEYGIQIFNSGSGRSGHQIIKRNEIHNCEVSGILAYNVTGSFEDNYIHDNNIGIKLLNNCNIALFGNSTAQNQTQTQRIIDNISYELYCTQYSFPYYFRYNVIIDEDNLGNPSDPLVFYDNPTIPYYYKIDVQYNCWGNNFDPTQDLRTYNGATWKWYPTWCPGGTISPPDPVKDMYYSAVEEFENSNYYNAKNLFQLDS